nr:ferredoxin-dependent glutamate synthase, chloroplastic [Tanacetum cinerariifolium]
LAQLEYKRLDDIIGHTELLRPRDISLVKTQHLDFGYVLSNVGFAKWSIGTIRKQEDHSNGPVLDDIILSDPERFQADLINCREIYFLVSRTIATTSSFREQQGIMSVVSQHISGGADGSSSVEENQDRGASSSRPDGPSLQQQQRYPIPPGQGMGEVRCRQIISLPLTGKKTASGKETKQAKIHEQDAIAKKRHKSGKTKQRKQRKAQSRHTTTRAGETRTSMQTRKASILER